MTSNNSMWMTTRKLLIEQKKTLMFLTLGYLGVAFVFGMWFGLFGATPGLGMTVFYFLIAGLVCSLVSSKMFSDISRKEGRTALLMLPVTAGDKFWPRFIAVLPGMMLLVLAGYVVMNYACILGCGLMHGVWGDFFNPYSVVEDGSDTVKVTLSSLSSFLFSQALFIYGSVAWPKKSFLKTLGVFVIIQMALGFLGVLVMKVSPTSFWVDSLNQEWIEWTTTGLVTAVTIGLIYMAYNKFRNLKVA